MISTRNLDGLPDIAGFRRLTRALAMLDAIICPEWEFRYYSFNSHWADGKMMASMRNGSGDHWFALLCSDGIALHGLAHEAPMFRFGQPWPGIFDELPREFHDNFLREPAFDTSNSTFCIWRRSAGTSWAHGTIQFPAGNDPDGSEGLLQILSGNDPDGSEGLLQILSGNPETYANFARDYYEIDVSRNRRCRSLSTQYADQ